MASGTIERKCTKGHKKAEGRCSPRCVRWYPRVQRATRDGHGRRRFDYLGGYPTRATARSALDQAHGRHGDTVAPDGPSTKAAVVGGPAPPTLNDLLDHWLAHLHTNKALRLRTIGRYRQLLAHHVRPYLGTLPVSSLGTLHIQQLYDQLAHEGRKDGKPGGLGPRTIRQVHLCLHQALGYAMKWHGLPANPAADAEPPAIPAPTPAALTPDQVGTLLAAAHHEPRPWLRAFTVLPAATGARTGELCGLERHDLDLAAGTVRFRQALSSIDQQLATGRPRPGGRRGKLLVVGPLKTPASQAALSLPTFAVHALRAYQQAQGQRTPLRLLLVQPGEAPGRSSSTWCCAPSGTPQCGPSTPAGRSGPSPATPGSRRIPTCCATRWPRRWRRPRSPPASSPGSCATPTAARWPVEPTSTSSPRPHPAWPGSSRTSIA
jgi:integrase